MSAAATPDHTLIHIILVYEFNWHSGLCRMFRTLLFPNGFSWILMDPHGSSWILVDPLGSWWILMDPDGSSWILVDPLGSWWILMDPGGSWWILMDPWVHQDPPGSAFSPLVTGESSIHVSKKSIKNSTCWWFSLGRLTNELNYHSFIDRLTPFQCLLEENKDDATIG